MGLIVELILIAIPFFFLLIATEIYVDRKRKTGFYQWDDTISSLNLGVMSRLVGVFKLILPFSAYVWLYQQTALLSIALDSVLWWTVAFVVYDLGYYWVHRLSHRIHVMWGSHVVHHSSEEYNLTTALRQTGTPALFAWIVFLPMALLGVPPEMLLACGSLNLIYQFWVHTQHIDKMPPWFEAVFVTPSHHRVHHALNKDYIDKNYAGVFILWDKLFNSFQAEKNNVEIVYGVSHQLNSWNPLWANFQVYRNLLQDALYTRHWRDKIKTFLMPPGWRAADAKQGLPRKYANSKSLQKYAVAQCKNQKIYVLTQFLLLIPMVFWFLLQLPYFAPLISVGLGLFGIYHCWVISVLQEHKTWQSLAEPLRLLGTGFIAYALLQPQVQHPVFVLILAWIIASLFSFTWLLKQAKPAAVYDNPQASHQSDV
ncbi:sterol desaturase family protein [Planctobacterium marinum]|uniref:sterol desaturase family protein n=1 Tax=Planctobacterium marinum TaxID=1631968 RepID=UPI001E2E139C|nr:sterol desaturase family protein [Planctobacterium marinum]MCC2606691.1 sterol desaturase family protein [Planctobacterium marinum]